jgi:hypothetical protein
VGDVVLVGKAGVAADVARGGKADKVGAAARRGAVVVVSAPAMSDAQRKPRALFVLHAMAQ